MVPSNWVRLHAVLHGEVQGVFLRAHTQEWAQDLGLRGIVRNRNDGTVEVIAEGKKPDLDALVIKLKQGSPSAKIAQLYVDWFPATNEFKRFEIIR